jgi:adenine phosphoribosyltransferase
MHLETLIRTIPDYPKPGIMFRDITTLLEHAEGFKTAVDRLVDYGLKREVDVVAGIEARGFILGGAVAYRLGKGFVPIRKKGKLPGETIGQSYDLEYGTDAVELHVDAVKPGQKVLLIDDLIATGGTALAASQLIKRSGGVLEQALFIVELVELQGRMDLEEMGIEVHSLIQFDGE